jgi:hypothetical protein
VRGARPWALRRGGRSAPTRRRSAASAGPTRTAST